MLKNKNTNNIKKYIYEIPDWPNKGVNFKDITPLLQNAKAFKQAIDNLAKPYLNKKVDKVIGIDARGFIFASALAYKLKLGLAIVRKMGKLPRKTLKQSYNLEYASNTLEIHRDSIKKGEKIIIVDDVLATGGTIGATAKLIERIGGQIIGITFLIEIKKLNGRKRINHYPLHSLIRYEN